MAYKVLLTESVRQRLRKFPMEKREARNDILDRIREHETDPVPIDFETVPSEGKVTKTILRIRAGGEYRIVYYFLDDDTVRVFHIGDHDETWEELEEFRKKTDAAEEDSG